MSASPRDLLDLCDSLRAGRGTACEVYRKSGQHRRLGYELGDLHMSFHEESGWAVRVGNAKKSVHWVGCTAPQPGMFPDPVPGVGLELPAAAAREEPEVAPIEAPLLSEGEGVSWLRELERNLETESPGSRLQRVLVEDGSAETTIVNSHGLVARTRSRIASCRIWARKSNSSALVELALTSVDARQFSTKEIARTLGDRLEIGAKGSVAAKANLPVVLAPEAVAALLFGLRDLVFASSETLAAVGLGEELHAEASLVDDPTLPAGPLSAPFDGEGVPTRRVVVLREGRFVESLRPWNEQPAPPFYGCRRRPGFRDLPRRSPSQLHIPPGSLSVADLLSEIERGYYLLAAWRPARWNRKTGEFSMDALGFELRRGVSARAVSSVRLEGSLASLFAGLRARGRDLRFRAYDALYGGPSVLIEGLAIGL